MKQLREDDIWIRAAAEVRPSVIVLPIRAWCADLTGIIAIFVSLNLLAGAIKDLGF
jgi:hypothetical protein